MSWLIAAGIAVWLLLIALATIDTIRERREAAAQPRWTLTTARPHGLLVGDFTASHQDGGPIAGGRVVEIIDGRTVRLRALTAREKRRHPQRRPQPGD